jgi:nucleotide-binding universal stress UspA family protein
LEGKQAKLFGSKKLLDQLEVQSKEQLARTFHKIVLDNNNPQHHFQTLSKKGNLSKIIIKTIDAYQIDLLVMGSKGKTGAKEIFLGSNTIQVANTMTKCPVLAVPKQMDYKIPKEIAFVTDFKKGCAKETIAPLLSLASYTKASIRVMHITEEEILNKEQESHRKLLEVCLKDVDHSFHWVRNFADKAQVIDTFLEKLAIDMFAMVHHKRSFIEKWVREPVVKDVSIYSDIPFLILPLQD